MAKATNLKTVGQAPHSGNATNKNNVSYNMTLRRFQRHGRLKSAPTKTHTTLMDRVENRNIIIEISDIVVIVVLSCVGAVCNRPHSLSVIILSSKPKSHRLKNSALKNASMKYYCYCFTEEDVQGNWYAS